MQGTLVVFHMFKENDPYRYIVPFGLRIFISDRTPSSLS